MRRRPATYGASASGQSNRLAACIELFDPTMSLAATDLDLLFELTEAYYIEHPAISRLNWLDMGIRRHKYTHGGFGVPFADWRFGPFWRLLPAAPGRALALINRMLDHATDCRVSPRRRGAAPPGQPGGEGRDASAAPAVQLDIPGIGRKYFTGDEHVWGWYRGTGTGPYPCMSALMAVERIADQWLQLGTPLPGLITMLLRDAHNLAMPGLVVGLLARHAEQVAAEADPFLASPDVWELESVRAVMEAGIHAQGRDDPGILGSDRRSWTMADLAGYLVFNASNRGDQDRVDALRAAGSALAAAAGEPPGGLKAVTTGPQLTAPEEQRPVREQTGTPSPSGAGRACSMPATTRPGTTTGTSCGNGSRPPISRQRWPQTTATSNAEARYTGSSTRTPCAQPRHTLPRLRPFRRPRHWPPIPRLHAASPSSRQGQGRSLSTRPPPLPRPCSGLRSSRPGQ